MPGCLNHLHLKAETSGPWRLRVCRVQGEGGKGPADPYSRTASTSLSWCIIEWWRWCCGCLLPRPLFARYLPVPVIVFEWQHFDVGPLVVVMILDDGKAE